MLEIHAFSDSFFPLLKILSDGKLHTGDELAKKSGGITRAAISKKMKKIKDIYGIDLQSSSGKGYQLPQAIEFLSESIIKDHLNENSKAFIDRIEIHGTIDSTNNRATALAPNITDKATLICAEHQSQGRGRGDREWYSLCKLISMRPL